MMKVTRIHMSNVIGNGKICEDFAIINRQTNTFGVVDGATSMNGYKNENGQTAGFLAAQTLATAFNNQIEEETLEDTVLKANKQLQEKMIQVGINISIKEQLWSAAFVVYRINDDQLEYVHGGDCMLFLQYNDGSLEMVTTDEIAEIDSFTIQKRVEAKHSMSGEQLEAHVWQYINEQKEKMNTAAGYAVFNGEEALATSMNKGTVSLKNVKAIYTLTDGLFYPNEEVDKETDWNQTIHVIEKMGLEGYTDMLLDMEKKDSTCTVYPRHKVSDDKTAVIITLQ